jgi:hypothetical protein
MSAFHPFETFVRTNVLNARSRCGHRTRLIIAALAIAGLAMSCSASKGSECPELASIIRGNPIQDAQRSFAAGDHRLLSLGGFVGTTPGAESEDRPSRELPGTSDDMSGAACRAYGVDAERYAKSYNKTMIALLKRTK